MVQGAARVGGVVKVGPGDGDAVCVAAMGGDILNFGPEGGAL